MRKLKTDERRRLVAEQYLDESLPVAERSSRALGARLGVSHRTILNDLQALGIEERLSKPPAGGISKEERQRRVRELYATHSCAEIADELGCSVQPIKLDIHELGLDVREARPRRKLPEPESRPCECGCGETFTPTASRVKDGNGKYKNREHYRIAKRLDVLEVAALAAPLWNDGATGVPQFVGT